MLAARGQLGRFPQLADNLLWRVHSAFHVSSSWVLSDFQSPSLVLAHFTVVKTQALSYTI
jgi:hypothetical protein